MKKQRMKSKRKNNTKKLKLRIIKFDRLLVVEQLEKRGYFKNTDHVKIDDDLWLLLESINLQKDNNFGRSADHYADFTSNAERDEYLTNLIKWITEEQFGGVDNVGELEVGKECLVSDDGKKWKKLIFMGDIIRLPRKEKYFLAVNSLNNEFSWCWKYAKPINDNLTINGEYYTWEAK